ncbi:hypothetical protein MSAN_00819100 [Mycena sanguinolenta]|uniref:Uncharacterized protein n=1 Tax=Mycena sanguinolenta TaxID=230812 RepID=A0A8H6YUW1_9AGAR|nr:hypothetical protein MSAN_00819100 [Mycena sanguinolenta]
MDWIDDQFGVQFLPPMAPYRARLEHLILNRVSFPDFRAIEGPLPRLGQLELLLYDHDQEYSPMASTKLSFHEAPLLRTVLVNSCAIRNTIIPWAQLTSLALHGLLPQDCAPILQQTCNLVHCELSVAEDSSGEDVPEVALPCLESLLLTHIILEDGLITGYLQTLTVPALRTLRVPELFLGPRPIDTLKSFVSKSGCNLEKLCVTGVRLVPDSSYQVAFPSTKVTFHYWLMSCAEWIMTEFEDSGEEPSATATFVPGFPG